MDISTIPPYTRARCPHCEQESRVKTKMGSFELTGRLGVGGMSYVFIGRDASLGRDVAVKILNEEYGSDPTRVAQFEREAKITASLSHPNIVRIFTVGEDQGRYFIAMELVRGDSLEALIRRSGAMPESEVLQVAIEVVEGLRAAASAGLIHRDIKPGNILIDEGGRSRIVDFGLALLTEEDNQSQEIWATPYYVPPETLEGADEDFRSDMYALGATLYHALAGRPPCPDDSLSIDKLKAAKLEIEPLGEANPNLNRSTVEVVEIAMAHAADDRFESYDLMLESLKLAAHSVATGEVVPPIRGSKRSRRRSSRDEKRKTMARVGAGVATLGAVALGIWLFNHFKSDSEAEVTPEVTDTGRQREAPPEEGAVNDAGDRIFELYQASRESIETKNFSDGANQLKELMNAPEAPVTTISWAAFEAAACFYQDGKAGDARKTMQELRRLLEQQGVALEGTASTADHLSRKILQLPPVEPKQLPSDPQGIEKLGYFVAGLKNWEQGQMTSAVRLFQKFVSLPLTDATEALAVYQERAKAYLRDAQRLVKAEPAENYSSIPLIIQQRELIDQTYMELETRGRARFQVREWNLSLARRQKELREETPDEPKPDVTPPKPATSWERIASLIDQWQFNQVMDELRKLETDESKRKQATFYLAETALNFKFNLMDLFESAKPELEGAEGEVLGRFVRFDDNRLVLSADEQEIQVTWSELSPSQLDRLFLARAKQEKSNFERELRFEQLIVFNYLVGDRDRAVTAGERLENEAFQKRWKNALNHYVK